jgi:hypothetical protein
MVQRTLEVIKKDLENLVYYAKYTENEDFCQDHFDEFVKLFYELESENYKFDDEDGYFLLEVIKDEIQTRISWYELKNKTLSLKDLKDING